jgi:peptide/nickel transport system substrate-binding protein
MKRMPLLLCIPVVIAGLFVGSCGDGDVDRETLTLLFWQSPSIANPYLSAGNKDTEAAALVLEPLANYDETGQLIPRLADSIPTVENGGVEADMTAIRWKLREGVLWSDGTPLTAEDVVFTYQYYCALPGGNCEIEPVENVEALDELTLQITFRSAQSYPYNSFVGAGGVVLQKAQFENCLGDAARQCEMENLYPIGTGPFRIADFRIAETGGASEITYQANERFRTPDQPFFSEVTLLGGGSAIDAARAVLETGEADFAWNLQVEPAILENLQVSGRGTLVAAFASNVERLMVNFTNPDPNLGDRRSEWSAENPNPHPFLSDLDVRRALSMAVDRDRIAEQLYGATGEPTCNIVTAPDKYVSFANDGCLMQDIGAANALLDDAGWLPDPDDDGIRQQEGVRLSILYQTSTNLVRQKTQELIRGWWQEIGVETILKDVDAGNFFGGDPANSDTLGRFYADVQMYTSGPGIDPQGYLGIWRMSEIASSENDWESPNVPRWSSPEGACQYGAAEYTYDALYEELKNAPLGQEREELVMALNDCLVQNYVLIPLVNRATVSSAVGSSLKGVRLNAWDAELWNIHEWYQ